MPTPLHQRSSASQPSTSPVRFLLRPSKSAPWAWYLIPSDAKTVGDALAPILAGFHLPTPIDHTTLLLHDAPLSLSQHVAIIRDGDKLTVQTPAAAPQIQFKGFRYTVKQASSSCQRANDANDANRRSNSPLLLSQHSNETISNPLNQSASPQRPSHLTSSHNPHAVSNSLQSQAERMHLSDRNPNAPLTSHSFPDEQESTSQPGLHSAKQVTKQMSRDFQRALPTDKLLKFHPVKQAEREKRSSGEKGIQTCSPLHLSLNQPSQGSSPGLNTRTEAPNVVSNQSTRTKKRLLSAIGKQRRNARNRRREKRKRKEAQNALQATSQGADPTKNAVTSPAKGNLRVSLPSQKTSIPAPKPPESGGTEQHSDQEQKDSHGEELASIQDAEEQTEGNASAKNVKKFSADLENAKAVALAALQGHSPASRDKSQLATGGIKKGTNRSVKPKVLHGSMAEILRIAREKGALSEKFEERSKPKLSKHIGTSSKSDCNMTEAFSPSDAKPVSPSAHTSDRTPSKEDSASHMKDSSTSVQLSERNSSEEKKSKRKKKLSKRARTYLRELQTNESIFVGFDDPENAPLQPSNIVNTFEEATPRNVEDGDKVDENIEEYAKEQVSAHGNLKQKSKSSPDKQIKSKEASLNSPPAPDSGKEMLSRSIARTKGLSNRSHGVANEEGLTPQSALQKRNRSLQGCEDSEMQMSDLVNSQAHPKTAVPLSRAATSQEYFESTYTKEGGEGFVRTEKIALDVSEKEQQPSVIRDARNNLENEGELILQGQAPTEAVRYSSKTMVQDTQGIVNKDCEKMHGKDSVQKTIEDVPKPPSVVHVAKQFGGTSSATAILTNNGGTAVEQGDKLPTSPCISSATTPTKHNRIPICRQQGTYSREAKVKVEGKKKRRKSSPRSIEQLRKKASIDEDDSVPDASSSRETPRTTSSVQETKRNDEIVECHSSIGESLTGKGAEQEHKERHNPRQSLQNKQFISGNAKRKREHHSLLRSGDGEDMQVTPRVKRVKLEADVHELANSKRRASRIPENGSCVRPSVPSKQMHDRIEKRTMQEDSYGSPFTATKGKKKCTVGSFSTTANKTSNSGDDRAHINTTLGPSARHVVSKKASSSSPSRMQSGTKAPLRQHDEQIVFVPASTEAQVEDKVISFEDKQHRNHTISSSGDSVARPEHDAADQNAKSASKDPSSELPDSNMAQGDVSSRGDFKLQLTEIVKETFGILSQFGNKFG